MKELTRYRFSIPATETSPSGPVPGEPSQSPEDPCARFCCSYDNVDSPNYARHLNGHGSPPAANSSQRDGIHGGTGGASSPYNHNYSGDGSYQYGRFDASALHIAHALKQTELQKGYSKAREKPIDYYLVSHWSAAVDVIGSRHGRRRIRTRVLLFRHARGTPRAG